MLKFRYADFHGGDAKSQQ